MEINSAEEMLKIWGKHVERNHIPLSELLRSVEFIFERIVESDKRIEQLEGEVKYLNLRDEDRKD